VNIDVFETLNALRALLDGVPDADTLTLADLHCQVLDLLEAPYRDEARRVAEVLDREGVTRAEAEEALAALEARIGPDHPDVVYWRTVAMFEVAQEPTGPHERGEMDTDAAGGPAGSPEE
jgi:hypothetical protein